MCRLLAYLGPPIQLDRLLYKPEHSLIVQSYQPQEMTSGVVNADGFGVGWYHPEREVNPFIYKNTLPIWNDTNLSNLSRYVESGCVLGSIRSATAGQEVNLSNCQPFQHQKILGIHNGFIQEFRKTLYRPIRSQLNDTLYQAINGTTDSEHIFALILHLWQSSAKGDLVQALQQALRTLYEMAESAQTQFSANIVVSDGQQLVGSRFAHGTQNPSLYWLRDDPCFPESVVVASEPLFAGNWVCCPEDSVFRVGGDLEIQVCSV